MQSTLETFLTLCRCLSQDRSSEAISALDKSLAQLTQPGLSGPIGGAATLTHPFSRYRIDCTYGDAANPLRRAAHRLHRARTLVRQHRGGLSRKFAQVRRGHYLSR